MKGKMFDMMIREMMRKAAGSTVGQEEVEVVIRQDVNTIIRVVRHRCKKG